jgi:hypothetical protein
MASPCLHPVFGPGFTPYRLYLWYLQSKEILLNLSMNHWNSAFNAQGLRIIVLIVQIRALKICIAGGRSGGDQEKGKTGWKLGLLTTKIGGKTSLGPNYFAL